jgi:hypothetical protein
VTAETTGRGPPHDDTPAPFAAMYAAFMARLPPAESPLSDIRVGSPPYLVALAVIHPSAQPICRSTTSHRCWFTDDNG